MAETLALGDPARWRDPSFWTSLVPDQAITDQPFGAEPTPFEQEAAVEHRDQLRLEGYFVAPPLIDRKDCEVLSRLIGAVVAAGFPAPFAMVYDAPWRMLDRLRPFLGSVLGHEVRLVPDFWVWYVGAGGEPSGWRPHRDNEFEGDLLRPDGRPYVVTAWIPLTPATPRNSCIYALPTDRDPAVPDHLEDELVDADHLQDVRALPADAGSVLGWTQQLLHWGSRPATTSEDPRVSIGMYVQTTDAEDYELARVDPEVGVTLIERLCWIGRMGVKYPRRVPSVLHPFCEDHAKLQPGLEAWRRSHAPA